MSRTGTSPLLLLPNELIQTIYYPCLEPNMALASGLLGIALSSEAILDRIENPDVTEIELRGEHARSEMFDRRFACRNEERDIGGECNGVTSSRLG